MDSIRHALSSTTTCSASTVALLQQLLSSNVEEGDGKHSGKTGGTSGTASIKPSIKPRPRVRAKTQLKSTAILQIHTEQPVQLKPHEKLILATDTVNSALKNLADALKQLQKPAAKAASPLKDRSTAGQQQPPRTGLANTGSARPLKSRSPNSPDKRSALRRSFSSTDAKSRQAPGILATAECARSAFAYLRAQDKSAKWDGGDLQLENGSLAFVGKCLALELDSMALKELKLLKTRLERGQKRSDKGTEGAAANNRPESIVDLLMLSGDFKECLLPLIITYQSYVLKAIVRRKRPGEIELLAKYLELDQKNSPASLILKQAANPDSTSKCARQLESLSNSLLLLCPTVSSTEDKLACDARFSPSPDSTFCLQFFAFRIRLQWWEISGHNGSTEKELWTPLSRCFGAFYRRSATDSERRYSIANNFLSHLELAVKSLRHVKNDDSTSKASISKSMSSLAQAAGKYKEAINWLAAEDSTQSSNRSSEATLAAFAVRIATLVLQDSDQDQVAQKLDTAYKCLAGNLRGEVSDLDALLLEVAGFRRALIKSYLQERKSDCPGLAHHYTAGIFSCVHFLLRYLGSPPKDDVDSKASIRYNERLIKTQKAALGFIESVIICCKLDLKDKTAQWETMEAALQDCCYLNEELRNRPGDISEDSEELTAVQQTAVRLSSLYWAYYVQEFKMLSSIRSPAFKALQRSIDILRKGCEMERRSGLFVTKLEKMAESYQQLQDFQNSYDCMREVIGEHIRNGTVDSVSDLASSCSLDTLWNSDESALSLSKTLDSIHSIIWRGRLLGLPNLDFYDDTELETEKRALLLERQLHLTCSEILKPQQASDAQFSGLDELFGCLFEIYDPEKYPIRRQRVALAASRLMNECPELLSEATVQAVKQSISVKQGQITNDSRLGGFSKHLTASISVNLALQERPVDVNRVEQALRTWTSLSDQPGQSLQDCVEDIPGLIRQLNLIIDYFDLQGLDHLQIPTLSLLGRILELQNPSNTTSIVENMSRLSLQYLRAGYSGKSGITLEKTQELVDSGSVSTEAMVNFYLAYSEHYLSIGALSKCEHSLAVTEDLCRQSLELTSLATKTSLLHKIQINRLLSNALYSFSLLKLESGHAGSALSYAKRCVKLLQRNWALLENAFKPQQRIAVDAVTDSDLELSVDANGEKSSMRHIRVVVALSTTHDALNGSQFWSLVPSLRRSYYHLSTMFAHHGLFSESIYWVEQAQKIAQALGSPSPLLRNFSVLAGYWIKADQVEKGQSFLDQALDSGMVNRPSLDLVQHQLSVAYMWKARLEPDDAVEALDSALETIQRLTDISLINSLDRFAISEGSIVAELAGMHIEDSVPPAKTTRKGRSLKKPAPKTVPKTTRKTKPKTTAEPTCRDGLECIPLLAIRADIFRKKSFELLLKDKITIASDVVDQAEDFQTVQSAVISQQIAKFRKLFHQVLKAVASDCAFSVLPDSTVSIPATSLAEYRQSDQSLGRSPLSSSPKDTITRPSPGRKIIKSRPVSKKQDFKILLRVATDCLADVHFSAMQTCSMDVIHQLCGLLAGAAVYLSAMNQHYKSLTHPMHTALLLDQPKIMATQRDSCVAWIDGKITKKEELHRWPTVFADGCVPGDIQSNITAAQFQREYVDIIPEAWTAISLSLNERKDELYVTRYRTGQTPFIIRLPMTRHKGHDLDEDEFSYQAAKGELQDIVDLSNITTHGSRYINTKQAKAEWWAEREALNSRLQDLLLNIENIWLGGFRGIFSQQARQPLLLSRLQKSLQTSFNRHLPSRQGRGQPKTLNLDPLILELFAGLGDPRDENVDLDDSLIDLLYFVVDILQFNGERNAYDEIDFDSLVVDTTDALRSYHSASISSTSDPFQHTILILDKHIHCFPWESLPSLKLLNVSRLPSLECLRTRILGAKASGSLDGNIAGHHISRSNGASLLNPSGDLTNTQQIMHPLLQSLPEQWSHSTIAPREAELTDLLSSQSLFLYFGHGSGSQYIRNRSVRRLPQCPTTWLMGCSSSAMTDHGDFEPSGMVLSYLAAGSPAVVGTLWDVTDKDCDRASVKAGEVWGLWEAGEAHKSLAVKGRKGRKANAEPVQDAATPAATTGRGKRRAGQARETPGSDRVSLVEAVRTSREECYLRYLNGAAIVVYGIPVFLDD